MIRIRPSLRFLIAAAVLALPLIPLAPAPAAMAASLGGIDVLPAKGNASTPMSLVTERGCAEPATLVSAVALGRGFPDGGQIIVAPNEVLFSTTRPMELPVSNAFVVYADRNNAALEGTYTIKVRCTDQFGVKVLDEFSTTMRWQTPNGSLAKIGQATYTAVNSAGVAAEYEKQRKAAERLASEQRAASRDPSTDGSQGGVSPGPRPGEIPLPGGERPDGSDPGAAVKADEPTTSDARPSGSGTPLLVGVAVAALALATYLILRRRSASTDT